MTLQHPSPVAPKQNRVLVFFVSSLVGWVVIHAVLHNSRKNRPGVESQDQVESSTMRKSAFDEIRSVNKLVAAFNEKIQKTSHGELPRIATAIDEEDPFQRPYLRVACLHAGQKAQALEVLNQLAPQARHLKSDLKLEILVQVGGRYDLYTTSQYLYDRREGRWINSEEP